MTRKTELGGAYSLTDSRVETRNAATQRNSRHFGRDPGRRLRASSFQRKFSPNFVRPAPAVGLVRPCDDGRYTDGIILRMEISLLI